MAKQPSIKAGHGQEALLQVYRASRAGGGVCAGAVFRLMNGQWQCTLAAPILTWMYETPVAAIRAELRRRGYRYGWIANGVEPPA